MAYFIAFEGIDGSGKSTMIQALADQLKQKGQESVLTREPGGTPLAEEVRKLLIKVGEDHPVERAELLLYEASRAQHVEKVIRPALAAKKWVLCDRFVASSIAFQSYGRGLDAKWVEKLNEFAVGSCLPHLNVLLDLSVEESQRRRQKRYEETGDRADRFEQEENVFHQAVRDGYLQIAKENARDWLLLDAHQKPEVLHQQLIDELRSRAWLES